MRIIPITELLRLTRSELLNLQARITGALATLPTNSLDYAAAMINLRNVQDMLARPAPPSPWRIFPRTKPRPPVGNG